MYADINDYIRECYGNHADELLYHDGGRMVWDIFFASSEVHVANYLEYIRILLLSQKRERYEIDPLLFLPCCNNKRKGPMPDIYIRQIESRILKKQYEANRSDFLFFTGLPLFYAIPERIIRLVIENYPVEFDVYDDSRDMTRAKKQCQEQLSRIYKGCKRQIKENTICFLGLHMQVLAAYEKMAIDVDQIMRGMDPMLNGSEMLLLQIRPLRSKKEERKMTNQQVIRKGIFPLEVKSRIECIDFYKNIAQNTFNDKTNGKLMTDLYTLTKLPDEKMDELFLNDLFSKDKDLKEFYRTNKRKVFNCYFYEKSGAENRILNTKERIDDRFFFNRNDILAIFLNMIPESEDSEHLLIEEARQKCIEEYLQKDHLLLSYEEALFLLTSARKGRMKKQELLKWMRAYFLNEKQEKQGEDI